MIKKNEKKFVKILTDGLLFAIILAVGKHITSGISAYTDKTILILLVYAFMLIISINVNTKEGGAVMKIAIALLLIITFFLELAFLVHICAKNKYALKYSSKDRKIEIYPSAKLKDKSHPINR